MDLKRKLGFIFTSQLILASFLLLISLYQYVKIPQVQAENQPWSNNPVVARVFKTIDQTIQSFAPSDVQSEILAENGAIQWQVNDVQQQDNQKNNGNEIVFSNDYISISQESSNTTATTENQNTLNGQDNQDNKEAVFQLDNLSLDKEIIQQLNDYNANVTYLGHIDPRYKNEQIPLTMTVKNTGRLVGTFWFQIKVEKKNWLGGGDQVFWEEKKIYNIYPNQEKSWTFNWTPTSTGDYRYIAKVLNVPKTATYDSWTTGWYPVIERPFQDLLIHETSYIAPTSVTADGSFTANFWVYNPNTSRVEVGLGVSIRKTSNTSIEYYDTSNDTKVWVEPGGQYYSLKTRNFDLSKARDRWGNRPTAGNYEYVLAIWPGDPGVGSPYGSTGWQPGLTLIASQGWLYLRVTNNDDDNYSYVYFKIDNSEFNKYISVNSGSTVDSNDQAVSLNQNHTVTIKWTDSDTNQTYEKSETKYVSANSRVEYAFTMDRHLSSNSPPAISDFSLTPSNGKGNIDTDFTFRIKYTDLDDNEPNTHSLRIYKEDGYELNRNLIKFDDDNHYNNGTWYSYTTKLPRGLYSYEIKFNDDPRYNHTDDTTEQSGVPLVENRAPNIPSNGSPSNIDLLSNEVTFSWNGGDPDGDGVGYDVQWGTSPNNLNFGFSTTQTSFTTTLASATTYYWKVVATDNYFADPKSSENDLAWEFITGTPPRGDLEVLAQNVSYGLASVPGSNAQIKLYRSDGTLAGTDNQVDNINGKARANFNNLDVGDYYVDVIHTGSPWGWENWGRSANFTVNARSDNSYSYTRQEPTIKEITFVKAANNQVLDMDHPLLLGESAKARIIIKNNSATSVSDVRALARVGLTNGSYDNNPGTYTPYTTLSAWEEKTIEATFTPTITGTFGRDVGLYHDGTVHGLVDGWAWFNGAFKVNQPPAQVGYVRTLDVNGNEKSVFNPNDTITYRIYTNRGQDPLTVYWRSFDSQANPILSLTHWETINNQPNRTTFDWPTFLTNINPGIYNFRGEVNGTTSSVEYRINQGPNSFGNLSPANGVENQSTSPTVSWQRATDSDGDSINYEVWLGTSENSLTKVSTVSQTSVGVNPTYQFTNLSYNTHYWWQIKAVDSYGLSTQGNKWKFKTKIEDPPTVDFSVSDIDKNSKRITGTSYDFTSNDYVDYVDIYVNNQFRTKIVHNMPGTISNRFDFEWVWDANQQEILNTNNVIKILAYDKYGYYGEQSKSIKFTIIRDFVINDITGNYDSGSIDGGFALVTPDNIIYSDNETGDGITHIKLSNQGNVSGKFTISNLSSEYDIIFKNRFAFQHWNENSLQIDLGPDNSADIILFVKVPNNVLEDKLINIPFEITQEDGESIKNNVVYLTVSKQAFQSFEIGVLVNKMSEICDFLVDFIFATDSIENLQEWDQNNDKSITLERLISGGDVVITYVPVVGLVGRGAKFGMKFVATGGKIFVKEFAVRNIASLIEKGGASSAKLALLKRIEEKGISFFAKEALQDFGGQAHKEFLRKYSSVIAHDGSETALAKLLTKTQYSEEGLKLAIQDLYRVKDADGAEDLLKFFAKEGVSVNPSNVENALKQIRYTGFRANN